MSPLLNKVLNFVGWESEEEDEVFEQQEGHKEELNKPSFVNTSKKQQQSKVLNIHSANQFKVVVVQPDKFEDAQDICNHLKNKKPIIINLENVEKDEAQRIIDFISGAVYSLDGSIQKVTCNIFLIAPNNVDIMGDFREELKNKGVFSWAK